jgi:hypothetical protein
MSELDRIRNNFTFRLTDRIKRVKAMHYMKQNGEVDACVVDNIAASRAVDDIKEMFLGLLGEMEHRETEDMSLKSWTPEDYKAFGRNELRSELIKKIGEL